MIDHYHFIDAESHERAVYRDRGNGSPGCYLEALAHETLELADLSGKLVVPGKRFAGKEG